MALFRKTGTGYNRLIFFDGKDFMTLIYHMADRHDWQSAMHTGWYPGTIADRQDGFIHFSTAETVRESAAKHRKGVDNLLLIGVEAELLGDALKWEKARGNILFPHLYGALDTKLVSVEYPLRLDADGEHVFPELQPSA